MPTDPPQGRGQAGRARGTARPQEQGGIYLGPGLPSPQPFPWEGVTQVLLWGRAGPPPRALPPEPAKTGPAGISWPLCGPNNSRGHRAAPPGPGSRPTPCRPARLDIAALEVFPGPPSYTAMSLCVTTGPCMVTSEPTPCDPSQSLSPSPARQHTGSPTGTSGQRRAGAAFLDAPGVRPRALPCPTLSPSVSSFLACRGVLNTGGDRWTDGAPPPEAAGAAADAGMQNVALPLLSPCGWGRVPGPLRVLEPRGGPETNTCARDALRECPQRKLPGVKAAAWDGHRPRLPAGGLGLGQACPHQRWERALPPCRSPGGPRFAGDWTLHCPADPHSRQAVWEPRAASKAPGAGVRGSTTVRRAGCCHQVPSVEQGCRAPVPSAVRTEGGRNPEPGRLRWPLRLLGPKPLLSAPSMNICWVDEPAPLCSDWAHGAHPPPPRPSIQSLFVSSGPGKSGIKTQPRRELTPVAAGASGPVPQERERGHGPSPGLLRVHHGQGVLLPRATASSLSYQDNQI